MSEERNDVNLEQNSSEDEIVMEVAVAASKKADTDDDCNTSMLDSMDSCVACVEGMEKQHDFEEAIGSHELIDMTDPTQHRSLSPAEAALIRLQIMEKQQDPPNGMSTITDLDLLNICGSDEDMSDAQVASVVTPPRPTTSLNAHKTGETEAQREEGKSLMSTTECFTETQHPLQCAICFDEALESSRRIAFAKLPCCGHAEETSTVKICTSCILVLSDPTSDGGSRIGRCPRCRSWIVVATPKSPEAKELDIQAVAAAGKCHVCNQNKSCLVEDASVCDACFLGRQHPLLYECGGCHVTQRIPHPMYRYQDRPEEFGNVTWACHGRCGNFTNWRIRTDQLGLIPAGDAPESWGTDYLEAARARVQEARTQLAGRESSTCAIL